MFKRLDAHRNAHVGKYLLPNPCKHPAEYVVLETDSYTDGGLRIEVHEWVCLKCHRTVRRQWGTCDVGRRVWPAAMWD